MTFVIALALLVGIAVVFILARGTKNSERVSNQPAVIEEIALVDTEIPATDVQQEADPAQAEVEDIHVVPTPRTGLESTDPATVNLASGEIQFVEVFAFW